MDIDYKKVGFLCGLEIHQRLLTDGKLFCSCDTTQNGEEALTASVHRKQRAVAGELGNIDMSARFEEVRSREFNYKIHDRTACLVDVDEEPPHRMNQEALDIVLSVSKALAMHDIYEIQVMRKEVVDGSNPSAFQRTALVGIDGHMKIGERTINLPSISVEEESAGIMSKARESMTNSIVDYNTERIGIPLVEISTDKYIESPKEAKSIAMHIGTLLRITGRVQRGIGSIRQDVNVSIKDGARTEIKGLQEIGTLDMFIENEVVRQVNLLKIAGILKKRDAEVHESIDLSDSLRGTKSKIIQGSLSHKGVVVGFRLSGFGGVIGMEVNPERRLGTEISDYAKMSGVHGIIHSDEDLKKYSLSDKDISEIRNRLKVKEGDAFVIIAGTEDQARNAARFSIERARNAIKGVPEETRGVYDVKKCTTRFLRPLPGGARMYPETDVRPILVTDDTISRARKGAPDIKRLEETLEKELHSKTIARRMMLSYRLGTYMSISDGVKTDKEFIANTLLQKFTELSREGFDVDSIQTDDLKEMFGAYASGDLTKQAVEEVIKRMSKGMDPKNAIGSKDLKRITGKKLKEIVDAERKSDPKAADARIMQNVMQKHRLNVDGEELKSIVFRKHKGDKK